MVANENSSVSVTLPAGATYRLGSGTSWSASITVAVPTTFSPLTWPSGVFPFPDPAPNMLKELDVMEIANAQNVAVTTNGINSTVVVPALPMTSAYTCTLLILADGTFQLNNCSAIAQ